MYLFPHFYNYFRFVNKNFRLLPLTQTIHNKRFKRLFNYSEYFVIKRVAYANTIYFYIFPSIHTYIRVRVFPSCSHITHVGI